MDFYDLIQNRESVRNYDSEKELHRKTLLRILNAGRLAPSAANRQPWRFLVVTSPDILLKLYESYNRDWFKKATVVLIVVGKREDAWVRPYDGYNSLETDLAIAMDHIVLAAENEGVGACWIGAFDPDALKKALPLKPGEEVFNMTPLGYQETAYIKKGNKIRKDIDEIAVFL